MKTISEKSWKEIRKRFDSAINHWQKARLIMDEPNLYQSGFAGYTLKMAILHAMQCGYTSCEQGIHLIMRALNEDPPENDTAFLERISAPIRGLRPAIFDIETTNIFELAQRFANLSEHMTDFMIDEENIKALECDIEETQELAGAIYWQLLRFREELAKI